jgi:hypothetical protein
MSLHPGSESTLALLYNARFRFRSIEAKLRYQADAELVERAKARWFKGKYPCKRNCEGCSPCPRQIVALSPENFTKTFV